MKIITFFFLTLSYLSICGQSWQWASNPAGHGQDYCWGVSADKFGNSYITGSFYDSIQFTNNISLQTALGTSKLYVAKYDASGNTLWANKIEGEPTINYHSKGISTDDLQNCYVVGEFADTLIIDTTIITTSFYNDSCYDSWSGTWFPCLKYYGGIFVAKFNSGGDLLWLKKICESKWGYLSGNAISIDNTGKCYIAGGFTDTLNLNNTTTIASNGGTTDIFLLQTDSVGNIQWIKKAGGNDMNADYATDIKVDRSGKSYITGIYKDTATFDSYVLPGTAMFVAKYDDLGNCLWAKKFGGVGFSNGIDVDKFGNCFVTGDFFAQASFDTISITSHGIDDIFVAKYSSSGICLWAKDAGGYYFDEGKGIAVDTMGNCYITGDMRDIVHFDSVILTCSGIDIFVAKFNSIGNFDWVVTAGNVSNYTDEGWDAAVDNAGSIFVTGLFEYSSLFGSTTLTSGGGSDGFIAKLFDNMLGFTALHQNKTSILIFPNPTKSAFNIELNEEMKDAQVEIYNAFGNKIYSTTLQNSQQTIKNKFSSGIYFVKVTSGEKQFVEKLIVQ